MNSFLTIITALLLITTSLASDLIENSTFIADIPESPFKTNLVNELEERTAQIAKNGCGGNICFVIDGSGTTNAEEFRKQKEFISLIVGITSIGKFKSNYGAAQMGGQIKIAPLIRNTPRFELRVDNAKQGRGLANIAGALSYCAFELLPRDNDANKIVILDSGSDAYGFSPKFILREILKRGVDVCAVTVGDSATHTPKYMRGLNMDILRVPGFLELSEAIVHLIDNTCNL